MGTGASSPDRFPCQSKAVSVPAAVRYACRGFPMDDLDHEEVVPTARFEAELQ
jgi:hypothetical protein